MVLGVVGPRNVCRALGDRGDLVEGRPGERPPGAEGHVAVGVVVVARRALQGSAGDGGDGVGLRGRGGRVGIGPDPGLREDVADIVIGDGLRGPADDGRLSEAVEDIVSEGLEDVGDDVAARGEIADRIEGEGEIGDGVRDAGGDRGDEAAVLVEGPVQSLICLAGYAPRNTTTSSLSTTVSGPTFANDGLSADIQLLIGYPLSSTSQLKAGNINDAARGGAFSPKL